MGLLVQHPCAAEPPLGLSASSQWLPCEFSTSQPQARAARELAHAAEWDRVQNAYLLFLHFPFVCFLSPGILAALVTLSPRFAVPIPGGRQKVLPQGERHRRKSVSPGSWLPERRPPLLLFRTRKLGPPRPGILFSCCSCSQERPSALKPPAWRLWTATQFPHLLINLVDLETLPTCSRTASLSLLSL